MRKLIMIFLVSVSTLLVFNPVNAAEKPGPAPNSGDGIPDGSGFPVPPSPGPGNSR